MAVELKVPEVGESITEVEIGDWLKSEGDTVRRDDPVVVIDTDKVTVELPAPVSGRITEIKVQSGEQASVGDVIGYMEEAEVEEGEEEGKEEGESADVASGRAAEKSRESGEGAAERRRPAAAALAEPTDDGAGDGARPRATPTAQRIMKEHGIESGDVKGTGAGGRVLKEDVMKALSARDEGPAPGIGGDRTEEAVPLSPLRRRVAERLVQAQREAAILTTFNEIDMSRVIELRRAHQDAFRAKHEIKLGFMSFFVKATIEALKEIPQLNAEIRGEDIVYRDYYDIGIAVGGGKGLVVPVIRDAHRLSFAEIEKTIADFAERAKENRLTLDELQGGTFTISNGGVYGSLLSTPILNPPQSGILGLHKIEERPVAVEGQVQVRPMMYVALSYDHRIVDGREAVTFLVRIKEVIEDPERILLEV